MILMPIQRATAETITIGVVKDGDSYFDEMVPLIKVELEKHLSSSKKVRFKTAESFNAQWNKSKVSTSIQAALDDPEVDYVLVTGPFTTLEVLNSSKKLTKPVLSSFVQISDVFTPFYNDKGHSKINNASFILVPDRVLLDIQAFKEMTNFKRLHILVSAEDKDFLTFLNNQLPKYEKRTGVDLELLPVSSGNIETVLNSLNKGDAVYLTYMPRLTKEQRKKVIEVANKFNMPSFSGLGHSDVHLGVLAAETPDMLKQAVRRTALNFSKVIKGADINKLSVVLSVDAALLINGETANKIGYIPDLDTVMSATMIKSEFTQDAGGNLTLQQAFKLAEKGNTSFSIKDTAVETAKQNKNVAYSAFLPQVSFGVNYRTIDSDRASLSPTVPKELSKATISINQILFSDELQSGHRSLKSLFEGSKEDRRAARLDAFFNSGVTFLQYSLARELFRIETNNMRLTKANLELAKLRYDVGYSGKNEVYRWESELYKKQQAVFSSKANIEALRIAFNQIVGVEQGKRWQPIRVDVNSEEFLFLDGKIQGFIKEDQKKKELIRSFFIKESLKNAPEIQFLSKAAEAQSIQLQQLRRSYSLPTVFANFSYAKELHHSGSGVPTLDDNEYSFAIGANYSFFEGGGKSSKIKKARSELEALEKKKKLVEEGIEQRVRTVIRSIESSFPSIKFSLMAAERARSNLDIVQEHYSQGTVNVTDLLEAQTQSFLSAQGSIIALYNHLIDLIGLQRSIAWFEDDQLEGERKEFINRLSKHLGAL